MARPAAPLSERLRALVADPRQPERRPLWIYGAGGFGRLLAERLRAAGAPVRGFVDSGAHAAEIDGLPCLTPNRIDPATVRDAALVYGIMNYATDPAPVLAFARASPFAALLFPADLRAFPGFALDHYWFAHPAETLDHLPEIATLLGRLDDEESRTLVGDILAYRLTTDPSRHPPISADPLYAPPFLPVFDRPLRFVDGGAYTGDTLATLREAGIAVSEWLAFEPDPDNFCTLRETARQAEGAVGRIELRQAVLAERSGTLRFAAGTGASSRIVEGEPSGTVEIPALRLDDAVASARDTYVKLDIEGAELGALRGMARLLADRATLAISLYHRPSDLWEIPKLVAELYDRPRMRIRQHHHHGFETVLYVWPA